MSQVILTRKDNSIGFIRLNRQEQKNTFTSEFANQLDQALWSFEEDDQVRVIVIEAAGEHFCTGIALDQFRIDRVISNIGSFCMG